MNRANNTIHNSECGFLYLLHKYYEQMEYSLMDLECRMWIHWIW